MVTIDAEGTITFSILLPQANSVAVVGSFNGWHEQVLPMESDHSGNWSLTVDSDGGEHVFRYLVDDHYHLVDHEAHGTVIGADGVIRARIWTPPVSQTPDTLAA